MGDVEVVLEPSGSDGPAPPGGAGPTNAPLVILVTAVGALLAALLVLSPSDTVTTDPVASTAPTVAPTGAAPSTTTIVPTTVPGEPVLGTEVGLEVWFGGDSAVHRVDLDTGASLRLEFSAYPLFATGDHVVVFEPMRNGYSTIDRRDPGAGSSPILVEGLAVDALAPSTVDGTLWVVDRSGDQFEWRLLSLSTGLPVRSATTQSLTTSKVAFGIDVAVGPEVDERGGQLFTLTESGHEFWMTGDVVVRNDERALIETCEGEECRVRWFDLRSREPIAVPTPVDLLEHTELLGGGAWIHERTADASTSRLVEVFTSRTFEAGANLTGRQLDVSPDGRWAGITAFQRLEMMNLVSGQLYPVPQATNRVGTSSSVVVIRSLGVAAP